MNQQEFNEYLEQRYYDQVNWYDNKANRNEKLFKRCQLALIALSALTPALVTSEQLLTATSAWVGWGAVVTSVAVAILASAIKTFRFQEQWINYRTTCETLRKEIHFYRAGIEGYGDADDKEALFVERVENLISRENTMWLTTMKRSATESPPGKGGMPGIDQGDMQESRGHPP